MITTQSTMHGNMVQAAAAAAIELKEWLVVFTISPTPHEMFLWYAWFLLEQIK